MNWELGTAYRIDGVQYFHTLNSAGTRVWVSESGNVYDGHPQETSTKRLGKLTVDNAPTPEKSYRTCVFGGHDTDAPVLFQRHVICRDHFAELRAGILRAEKASPSTEQANAFELRMWKEGYGEGYSAGFSAGEDIGRDRN